MVAVGTSTVTICYKEFLILKKEFAGQNLAEERPRHYSSNTARQRRRKKRQLQRLVFVASLAIVVIGIIILLISLLSSKPNSKEIDILSGVWVYDQYTRYEFDGYGNGCMCLEDVHYEYSYEISNNTVSMDFKNEAVHDCIYTFTVVEDKLTIIGGEGTTGGTYLLVRSN